MSRYHYNNINVKVRESNTSKANNHAAIETLKNRGI